MYKHYIEKDDNNNVTKAFSNAFESPSETSILVRDNTQERSFVLNILDSQGRYHWLYDQDINQTGYEVVDGVEYYYDLLVREKTEEEKVSTYIASKTLAQWKVIKKLQIDVKTQEIVARGYVYDGATFSLSLPAQSNFTNLYKQKDGINYPIKLSNMDNTTFKTIANAAAIDALYSAAFGAVMGAYVGGTTRKEAIENLTTIADVLAYVDDRA